MTVTDQSVIDTLEVYQPGVYDMTDDEYHRDPVLGGSLSSSGARRILAPSCPALFHHWRHRAGQRTKAMDFGTAAHRRILGVGTPIVVVDEDDWRKKTAQQQKIDAHAEGWVPMLLKDYARTWEMESKLRADPDARALFQPGVGAVEQSLFWVDPEFDVWRRARLDLVIPGDETHPMVIVDYKGLALDTAIPTPSGWTTMGSLQVGDQVFDSTGRSCRVTTKSSVHRRKCYRITFDDQSSVVCDDEHLWATLSGVKSGRRQPQPKVLSTEVIKNTLRLYGSRQHRITLAGPLDLPETELAIHPYVLGCWLGDGDAAGGRIFKPDVELSDLIAFCGYEDRTVPDVYLRASARQRLDLLRGLMDTNGSWDATRKQAVFMNTDKALSSAVRELACSLGQRAVMHQTTQHGFGLTVTSYPVTFTPIGMNPFLLTRKASGVTTGSSARNYRFVTSVDEIPAVSTQCIAVDSPDHTYLCTKNMIPTHNTTTAVDVVALAKTMVTYGYHQQGAWYLDAVEALGLVPPAGVVFVLVFQMSNPPYLVRVTQPEPEAIQWGRVKNRKAIAIYQECERTGVWPGYPGGVMSLAMPSWAERQLEHEWENGNFNMSTDTEGSES